MKNQKFVLLGVLLSLCFVLNLITGCCASRPVATAPAMEQAVAAPAEEKSMETEQAKEAAIPVQPAVDKKGEMDAAAAAAAAVAKEASQFEDIYFAFDRFDLRTDARKILDNHGKWLKAHSEYVVRIEGNCDERGTVEYNLALGERRAKSAMKYLGDLGIDEKRLSTVSYGKEKPLDPGHNEEAWAKNRRDHFVVTKK